LSDVVITEIMTYGVNTNWLVLPPFKKKRWQVIFSESQTTKSLTELIEKFINIYNTKLVSLDTSCNMLSYHVC
jgi:hypothetical protein